MKSYLEPVYDSHKSFYGKAYTETSGAWGQTCTLYSYETPVAMVGYLALENGDERRALVLLDYWDYSPTTLRHVKEFARQNGFYVTSKRDILRKAIDVCGELAILD